MKVWKGDAIFSGFAITCGYRINDDVHDGYHVIVVPVFEAPRAARAPQVHHHRVRIEAAAIELRE
jgi:hypothetical protein